MINAKERDQTRALAGGSQMPVLGLGVWQAPEGDECEQAVRWALEVGYRHIDIAQAYGNEESVGRALRASGVPREAVFVTTRLGAHPGRARRPPAPAPSRSPLSAFGSRGAARERVRGARGDDLRGGADGAHLV
ncbi:aldo/keto reductase [Conexibacter sp. S30A1]|jgi:aryl-alcohol dehydrogenase-like predicted oxidoreductase|uniref:aldo/keto reductase n=1 Tax=Conexibacter sp. S30A1 TaxID=2937800 RepID=UPI003530D4F7